ncbi:hypothetical protein SNEBB_007698 [Seison nebaliae]|nr:hypothetical protein SNEBB_007698 [Seison nebaliae]
MALVELCFVLILLLYFLLGIAMVLSGIMIIRSDSEIGIYLYKAITMVIETHPDDQSTATYLLLSVYIAIGAFLIFLSIAVCASLCTNPAIAPLKASFSAFLLSSIYLFVLFIIMIALCVGFGSTNVLHKNFRHMYMVSKNSLRSRTIEWAASVEREMVCKGIHRTTRFIKSSSEFGIKKCDEVLYKRFTNVNLLLILSSTAGLALTFIGGLLTLFVVKRYMNTSDEIETTTKLAERDIVTRIDAEYFGDEETKKYASGNLKASDPAVKQ